MLEMAMSVQFWNVTEAEISTDFPAHRYAIDPYRTYLRAVDVAAPAAVVFRWVCQLKVAPYSYDWLDNGGRRSPRELTAGADQLAVGQQLMIFRLVDFQPDRQITMVSLPAATRLFGPIALTYQVTDIPAGSRLVCCLDVTARSWPERARRKLLGAGDLVMMRKQLLTFKKLAERT
jgi:hypothetical protein